MAQRTGGDGLDPLLAEQVAYYRARAPEYLDGALRLPDGAEVRAATEIDAALDAFAATGDVLELACGPGSWTPRLLERATTVTAVDGAPEMLALARASVTDDRARFVEADLFAWRPERRYDAVFVGFWISHVPLERFAAFWALVAECLEPGGRVFFVDDAHRTPEELVEGKESSVIERRLNGGTAHRAVKVPHTAAGLEERLADLGWDVRVSASGPFYWGSGGRVR